MFRKRNTVGLLLFLPLCDMVLPLPVPPIDRFSLQVQCTGNSEMPGFGARAVKTYFSTSGEDPVEFVEPCTDSDSDSEEECLFQKFVLSLAREVCQGKENTILERLNINRTFVARPTSPHQRNSTSSVSVNKENQQESIMNSLKLGIALGTIFGFLFGVIVTSCVLVIFRKFKRNKKQRNPTNTVTNATTLTLEDNVKPGDQNDHINTYMYCDIEDDNYQIPKEMTCTGIKDSGASYRHDCHPLTYNHLNEKNDVDVSGKYDHFREVTADARKTNGEYKILEPVHSQDQLNSNKSAGNLPSNNDAGQEATSGQNTRTDAYFVLEKENQ